jgi:chitinase
VKHIPALLFAWAAACGGQSVPGSSGVTVCTPGRQVACACLDGIMGVQACASDGQRLTECVCSAGGSGGATGGSSGRSGAGAGGTTGGTAGATAGSGGAAGGGEPSGQGPFSVVDAEYSRALDRVVLLTTPAELHVHDPLSGAEDLVVTLPLPGRAVSIAPNGLTAAVGHDGWVSVVDLVGATLVDTVSTSADSLDLVLAGNGYVYVFPVRDQWTSIRCVNLETGTEELSSGRFIYAGTLARLSPRGDAIYGANNGLSPSDIERYDVSGGAASYLYDSPYHGDYYMCGSLWFDEPGNRIFTRCGNVFHSTDDESTDMRYAGSLDINGDGQWRDGIVDLVHSSAARMVLAIHGRTTSAYGGVSDGTKIGVYEDEFLALRATMAASTLGSGIDECSFVFFHSSGTRAFAVCGSSAGGQRVVSVPL